ncbi:carboxypeptidase-like regulatory domain-containing protein, partial [Flavobacterium sp. LBUM151]
MFFFSLLVQQSYAQQITITGKVASADGQPIPFANVIIKDTKSGAVTDFDGRYKISAAPNQTLVFSSQGFKTVEIAINNKTTID